MPHELSMPNNVILRGLVGSTAHGINIVGQDDRDEMGIYVESAVSVCGMMPSDHYIWRTQPDGVRSGPGDLDLTMYSLRKFCRLASSGNPSVLMLLWLPEYIEISDIGRKLVAIRESFISRRAGKSFLGYLIAQRQKMTGERSKEVSRPELVAKYGFDTKFAMHALRLGFEGIEMMRDGRLTLPVAQPNLEILRAVRTGGFSLDETLRMIRDAEAELSDLVEANQREANTEKIDAFMVEAHLDTWNNSAPS